MQCILSQVGLTVLTFASLSMSHLAARRMLVTGATGYIGQSFLQYVRHNHLERLIPIALVRPSSDILSLQQLLDYPSAEPSVIPVDFTDVSAVAQAVQIADVVVHLAADMDFFPEDEEGLISHNVALTEVMIEACLREVSRPERKGRPIRLVYVSSTEAIGPTDGEEPAHDYSDYRPASAYARSKVFCEQLVDKIGDDRLQTVIVRPSGVFGPGERFFFHEFMQLVATGLTIVAPSPLTGRVIFTHIDDVVDGLFICATHPKAYGAYNVCANKSVTYLEMIECISDCMHYPRPMLFFRPAVGQALISAIAPIMNRGKRRVFIYNAKTVRETLQFREYSNNRIKKLGFRPRYTVLSGVKETVEYEMASGSISTSFFPPLITRVLEILSVVVYGASRIMMGKGQRQRNDQNHIE